MGLATDVSESLRHLVREVVKDLGGDCWLQIFANFKVKMQKSSKVPKYKIQPKYQNMTVFC